MLKQLWIAAMFFTSIPFCVVAQWPGYEKNLIDYRPLKNWSEIDTVSSVTGTKISLYFPATMSRVAQRVLPEILNVDSFYSHQFFFWDKARPASLEQMEKERSEWSGFKKFFGFLSNPSPLARDSAGRMIIRRESWHPKEVVILLYPNMEDFRGQKIFPYAYLPPGVLGFTEYLNNRIALPYSGNWSEFVATMAHEMNHNYSKAFRDSVKREAGKTGRRKSGSLKDSPLWFDEGSADELARRYRGSGYREARAKEIILAGVLTDRWPRLEDLERPFSFLPYAFGRDFMSFMFALHNDSSHSRIQEYLAQGHKFPEAWKKTFGEHLITSYETWLKCMKINHFGQSFFEMVDSAIVQPIALQDFSLNSMGEISYDPDSRVIVTYFPDEKWGLKIGAWQIDSLKFLPIHYELSKGTFVFRLNNRPAIKGERVAVSIAKEGRDIIRIYDLKWFGEKTSQSILVKEITQLDSELLWVNDLEWIKDNLLFVGMRTNGQKDIYLLNTFSGKLSRITNNEEDKNQPKVFREGMVYLSTDSTEKTALNVLTAAGKKTWRPDILGFIDQLATDDSVAVMRVLDSAGSSHVIFWPIGHASGHIYRYGERISGDSLWRAYPFDRVLALRGDTLDILNNDINNLTSNRLRRIVVDVPSLPVVRFTEITNNSKAGILTARGSDSSLVPIKPADKSLRFATFYGYTLAVTNVVGDKGIWLNLRSGYNTNRGWNAYGNLGFYDFSDRLIKQLNFYADAGYRLHSSKKNGSPLVTYDEVFKMSGGVVWPFSFENRIELGLGAGYLWRAYVDSLRFTSYGTPDPKVQNRFHSPIFDVFLRYTHDGVWVDPLRTTKQGFYYMSRLTSTVTPRRLFLESSFVFDARYYWRPYDDPIYLANRLILGTVFGKDSYWFWWPELYRKPGFYNDDWNKSFGPRFALYQSELRIRLVRWIMYTHSFWKNKPLLLLSNNLVFFFYSGGVDNNQKWNFAARTGGRLRVGLFFLPVYFGFERYTYCDKINWHTAWTIELEY